MSRWRAWGPLRVIERLRVDLCQPLVWRSWQCELRFREGSGAVLPPVYVTPGPSTATGWDATPDRDDDD